MAKQTRTISIVRLSKGHDKKTFDCGNEELNEFLIRYAGQNERNGISITYAAIDDDSKEILAFYSISNGEVACKDLPEAEATKLPRYPIPVVRIGRLATSLSARGQGVGKLLLIDALKKTRQLSVEIGILAIEVDAKSPEAKTFYSQFGFVQLKDDELHLYLSLATVKKLFRAT